MTYTHRHIQYIEKGEDRREGWRGGGRRNEGKDGEEEEGGVKRGVEREGEEKKGGGKGRMERKERERSVHIPPLGFLLGNFFLFLSFFPVQSSRFSSIQP